ncbi:MAG: hypothetical protein ACXWHG_15645, partial [Thermoanaerobaculia bacterium]
PVDLADTMMRACSEEGLYERLARGIGPVHAMRASAREHLRLYGLEQTSGYPGREKTSAPPEMACVS